GERYFYRRTKSEYYASPGLILPSAFPDNCEKQYVCQSGFLGGHEPPFYFLFAVFSALDRGKNLKEEGGNFYLCGRHAQIGHGRSGFASRGTPGAGNSFKRHSATGFADRRPGAGVHYGNLRERFFGKNRGLAFCAGPSYPTGRSLCASGCQRRVRSGVGDSGGYGDEPFAVGALPRKISRAETPFGCVHQPRKSRRFVSQFIWQRFVSGCAFRHSTT